MKFKKENLIQQEKLSSGKWSFRVRIPGSGVTKRFSETTYGTAKSAYQAAIRWRNDQIINPVVGTANVSVREVFEESFDLLPIREETKRKTCLYFKNYVEQPDLLLSKITKADILQSLNKASLNQSDDTIRRIMAMWRRIYKTALIKNYINTDLTQSIVIPKSQKLTQTSPKKVLTSREELNDLLDKIDSAFNKGDAMSLKMALETMWYTGMRPAECFALNKNDFKDGYITIDKQLGSDVASSDTSIGVSVVVRKCKTKMSNRRIPICTSLQNLLNDYHVKGKIMFPTSSGEYFNLNKLGQKIHKISPNFTMYQIRHTVATHLIVDCGADERTVKEILGHEHINMSVYYARSNDEKKKSVLETM